MARDPGRKLGYSDRLIGTMRMALDHGVAPTCLAAGAAAGVLYWLADQGQTPEAMPDTARVTDVLGTIWGGEERDRHERKLVRLIDGAMPRAWGLRANR